MIKYTNSAVTFAEIPDEISLSISISNCDGLCEGCHSAELRNNIGNSLLDDIHKLIQNNRGISCVCFLGESGKTSNAREKLIEIIETIRKNYPKLKIALYSGRNYIDIDLLQYLNYYKVGPYIAALGPLNNKNTNQRLYKIVDNKMYDITNKF